MHAAGRWGGRATARHTHLLRLPEIALTTCVLHNVVDRAGESVWEGERRQHYPCAMMWPFERQGRATERLSCFVEGGGEGQEAPGWVSMSVQYAAPACLKSQVYNAGCVRVMLAQLAEAGVPRRVAGGSGRPRHVAHAAQACNGINRGWLSLSINLAIGRPGVTCMELQ